MRRCFRRLKQDVNLVLPPDLVVLCKKTRENSGFIM
eukprot:SAG22_NODE_16800_length_317_cov_0.940367_1_plen_35_part_01